MRTLIKLVTALLLCMNPGTVLAGEVTVAVAANFTDAARNLIPRFEAQSGHRVKVTFGSTGKLYAQIENGAPFELFLAADRERPQKAEDEGLAVAGTRFTYALGRLALWSAQPGLFVDQGEDYLKQTRFARAAIANPKTAPYGVAAQQVMEQLGIWKQVEKRLVRGESIAQTFQFTATGNAEVGFVALSQVNGWQGDGSHWEIPQSYYQPIEQQAVLLARARYNPAALAFLDFLRSEIARKVIADYGYGMAE